MAERLKTNQANVTRLERGRTQATIRTLKRIAEATGHNLVVIFSDKGNTDSHAEPPIRVISSPVRS
jgi:transcriptional regulator with XRE-family HTH domain